MNELYPLKFNPIFKEKIWGGQKIRTQLSYDISPLANCGEAWLLSGLEGNVSVVNNGFLEGNDLNELIEVYMGDLVGDDVIDRYGNEFPLLLKLIDTSDYLSVQVHPNDALAGKRHHCNGKTELWYVMDALEEGEIINGFKRKIEPEQFSESIKRGELKELLNTFHPQAGDAIFIPAGRIHALGPGLLLAEIQQPSDITYRIFDWNRTDKQGKPRDLHTELAMDSIDFIPPKEQKIDYIIKPNGTSNINTNPYFTTNLITISQALRKDYTELDSAVVYLCAEGAFDLIFSQGKLTVKKGEAILLPNLLNVVGLVPCPLARILEIYFNPSNG